MAEDYDFDPGEWSGHDFASAREYYDAHAGRSYAAALAKGTKPGSLIPRSIHTDSTSPLVIMVDVTGSMGEWPATIFSKLPYLALEAAEYLGADMEIAFGAVGDAAKGDDYPLQIRPFASGTKLKDELSELIVEGGGGGGGNESYELGALYYARNCHMPKADNPIFIFIADEAPYPCTSRQLARSHAKVDVEGTMSVEQIFAELQRAFSVYLIHKPYSDGGQARREWVRLLGEERIADLQAPGRVVDVIFGILARETERLGYFERELESRQESHQIDVVHRALSTIHRASRSLASDAKSTLHTLTAGVPAKKLL